MIENFGNLEIGKIANIVHGEAEDCSFEEKKWIAHVVLNRLKSERAFRNIEKDFKGYIRPRCITNAFERKALEDSINATVTAFLEHPIIDPTHGATFFATKHAVKNKDPTTIFGVLVIPVNCPESFKHNFYKLR